jgi:hypothetical protein
MTSHQIAYGGWALYPDGEITAAAAARDFVPTFETLKLPEDAN